MPTPGLLSAVNLIAAAGILGNVGGVPISANANLSNNISSYTSLDVVNQFANVSGSYVSINIVANTFPALTNAVPTAYQGNLGSGTITSVINSQSSTLLGSGDLGIFEQILNSADAYVNSTNLIIKSAVNANKANVTTAFFNSDNVITGGLSNFTLAFSAFSEDLARLGQLIDFENLPNLGTPGALLQQIALTANPTPALSDALLDAGIDSDKVEDLANAVLTDREQKAAYTAMTTITGNDLSEILKLLRVTTPNIGTMADLLNPIKIFPISFITFTTFTSGGLRAIYLDRQGTVNSLLEIQLPENLLVTLQENVQPGMPYSRLSKIIPPDQALANKAITGALQQVKTIFNTNQPQLTVATQGLETNKGLNIINGLTQPLPPNVIDYFANTYATGTGVDGTLLLTDVIGTPTGWVHNAALANTVEVMNTMGSQGAFVNLTNPVDGVYTVMANTLAGDYTTAVLANIGPPPEYNYTITIPGGLPGAGTYGPSNVESTVLSAAFVNLNANMVANVNAIVASYSNLVAQTTDNFANIAQQIIRENENINLAVIDIANLTPNLQPIGLATSLTSYGLDTVEGGAAFVLESVSDTGTQGGQAIVSTMRQARNQSRLTGAGIDTNIVISDEIAEPQAQLSSGQYSVSEAQNTKIV